MIKTTLRDKSLNIDFHHYQAPKKEGTTIFSTIVPQDKSYTQCIIEFDGQTYEGKAILSAKDNFNKSFGRKLSLKKALKNASDKYTHLFNKENRKFLWELYFEKAKK